MTKRQFIEFIFQSGNAKSKAEAARIYKAFEASLITALEQGHEVKLNGLLHITKKTYQARTSYNAHTRGFDQLPERTLYKSTLASNLRKVG